MYLLYWLITGALGRLPDVDRERFQHGFGWLHPEMRRKHWPRVWRDMRELNLKELPHSIENLSTEWTRLDEQRAQKYYRSWIHLLLLGMIVWMVVK